MQFTQENGEKRKMNSTYKLTWCAVNYENIAESTGEDLFQVAGDNRSIAVLARLLQQQGLKYIAITAPNGKDIPVTPNIAAKNLPSYGTDIFLNKFYLEDIND